MMVWTVGLEELGDDLSVTRVELRSGQGQSCSRTIKDIGRIDGKPEPCCRPGEVSVSIPARTHDVGR